MSKDSKDLGVSALLSCYRSGTQDPRAVVEACLDRLREDQAELNAVVCTSGEEAMESAARSRHRWLSGSERPLEGVPFGVKDILFTEDLPTSAGVKALEGVLPSVDAASVDRLRQAGAILVAKLQTFAWAAGHPRNRDYGATLNPHDLSFVAGGSSSGSAASVASGGVPLALGTDTGGSVRMPAAYCGVVGFKPTFGMISRYGSVPVSWTLDHIGFFTRTARDVPLVLDVLRGPDLRDPSTVSWSVCSSPGQLATLRGMRIGVPSDYFLDKCSNVCRDAFDRSLGILSDLGATINSVDLEDISRCDTVGRVLTLAEMAAVHRDWRGHLDLYDDRLVRDLETADVISAKDYLTCLQVRHEIQLSFARVFEGVDVLATPTTPTTAARLDTLEVESNEGTVPWLDVATRNTYPFNIAGLPAISVPMPVGGMPLGLQISAMPQRDGLVAAVGELFEAARS